MNDVAELSLIKRQIGFRKSSACGKERKFCGCSGKSCLQFELFAVKRTQSVWAAGAQLCACNVTPAPSL